MQKDALLSRQAEALTSALYPQGGLQERFTGAAYFLARYGAGLVDRLVEEAHDHCPGHKVIHL